MNDEVRYKLELRLVRYDKSFPCGETISELGVKKETIPDLFTQEVWKSLERAFMGGPQR